jgi:hypothetical protein
MGQGLNALPNTFTPRPGQCVEPRFCGNRPPQVVRQFCGRNDCTDRVFNQEEANSLVIEGDRFKRLVLNRNERHDLSVNRPCAGEILELDEKSVSNFLALCDY